LRGALGVASGDHDFCVGIAASNATDGGTGILIGRSRDSTGINHVEIGLRGLLCTGKAALDELMFESGAVSLGGTTAEVFDVIGGHKIIVAQFGIGRRASGMLFQRMRAERAILCLAKNVRQFRTAHPGPSDAKGRQLGMPNTNFNWKDTSSIREHDVTALAVKAEKLRRRWRLPLCKTLAAEDGTALSGAEGNGGFLATLGADGVRFHPAKVITHLPWSRSGIEHSHALGFAGFATLRFVPELFVVEEELFSGGKDELSAAIDALQYLVLKFHLRMAPFCPCCAVHTQGSDGGVEQNRSCTSPLKTAPGLGPPRMKDAWLQLAAGNAELLNRGNNP
jgi:hypothetical protein